MVALKYKLQWIVGLAYLTGLLDEVLTELKLNVIGNVRSDAGGIGIHT